MPVIYTFEAKSIQSYILDSSKLRDMVGASELIEDITAGLLDKVLQALKLQPDQDIEFSRKAGGAFIAILQSLEHAQNLRDLWTFTVRTCLPGLEFVQGFQTYQKPSEILSAEKATSQQKMADRNRLYPVYPIAGPLVARGPRTGAPAIIEKPNPNNEGNERLDKRTIIKRRFLERAEILALEEKLNLKTPYQDKLVWPKNLDPEDNQAEEQNFPTLGENRYIGVIHADGNGLGQLLMQVREDIKDIPQHYTKVFRRLSEIIEQATVAATRQATQAELVEKAVLRHDADGNSFQVMPARPLVLGGDDLTMIVRGDLAIAFTEKFLTAFEEHTETLFSQFKQEYKNQGINLHIPTGLTACAGISFVKASQPFYLAYHLAESLCKTAKTRSKQTLSEDGRVPASLAFHRITTSVIDDDETVCQRELTTPSGLLSMQPYAAGKIQPKETGIFPRLQDLDDLRQLLAADKISNGAVRELINLLYLSTERAERAYKRWCENMQKTQKNELREFDNILNNLLGGDGDQNLSILTAEENKRTPLADALAWNSIAA